MFCSMFVYTRDLTLLPVWLLQTLFTLLAEYMGDLALQEPPSLDLVSGLVRHLYELCQMAPLPAGLHLVARIRESQATLTQCADAHGGRGVFPTLDTVSCSTKYALSGRWYW